MTHIEEQAATNKQWITDWTAGIKELVDDMGGEDKLGPYADYPYVQWFLGKYLPESERMYVELVKDFHKRYHSQSVRCGIAIRFANYHDIWLYMPTVMRDRHPEIKEIMAYWEQHPEVASVVSMIVAKSHGPITEPHHLLMMWEKSIPRWHAQVFRGK